MEKLITDLVKMLNFVQKLSYIAIRLYSNRSTVFKAQKICIMECDFPARIDARPQTGK